MGFSLKTLGAVALAATIGTGASAATLTLSDAGAPGGFEFETIPGALGTQNITPANQVLDALFGAGASLGGYLGAQVDVDIDTSVKVEYFGFEASAINTFTIEGETVGKVAGEGNQKLPFSGNPFSTFYVSSGAGLLDFFFTSDDKQGLPTSVKTIANGDDNHGVFNFFASFGPGAESKTSGQVLWLFLDDNGVIGDNHDDLAIRISVVPLPAAGLMLLTALGGMGLMSRRKKAAA